MSDRAERRGRCSSRAQADTGLTRLRRSHPAGAFRDRPSTFSTASAWTRDGSAAGRGRMSLAAHLTPGVLRGPQSVSDRRRSDRAAHVRDRRTAVGNDAHACADVGGSRRAGTSVLGGDVSLPAARRRRRRRPPPGPRRCRLARDQRQDAEMAAQPSLQRHARRRTAGGRTHLGVRLPGDDADRVVARPDADGGRRAAHRRRGAVPHPQGDAAAVPVPAAAETLGAQGLPRISARGVLRRRIPTRTCCGCTAIRCRSRHRAR